MEILNFIFLRLATSLEEAESALKYLIFLADADKLYNVALGMYDFQLVVMVAQFSQKVGLSFPLTKQSKQKRKIYK
jgi:elongator complex protein 1